MEKQFAIKESTINAILQYLGKQAYTEVAQLIAGIVTECQQQPQQPVPLPVKPEVVVDNSEA
jgi:hypothetical protein